MPKLDLHPCMSFCFALCLTLTLYLCVVSLSAKPAKDRPEPVPDIAGVYGGAKGEHLYLVTITADGMYWKSKWEDENGRLCWAGTIKRDGNDFLERYDPLISSCPDWTWRAVSIGFTGKDDWKLSPSKPDF